MSAFAGLVEAANKIVLRKSYSHITEHPLQEYLPESYSLASLSNDLAQLDTTDPRTRLIAIFAALKDSKRVLQESDGQEAAIRLGDFAASTIAPCSSSSSTSEVNADNETDEYEGTAQRSRELAICGLEVLDICHDNYSAIFSDDTIITLISFTDARSTRLVQNEPYYHHTPPRHPWATPEATNLATRILEKQISKSFTTDTLIVRTILQGYLRPLFSKSRPSAVTASGRKAEFRDEEDTHRALRDEVETKPWKYADHRAIAVFQWAIHEANESVMAQQWPLFVPVVMALVDDGSTRVRSMGLHIMKEFLIKFPNKTLHDTGLASVFEDAILPTLHFLPTLTPEDESIQLLSPAFDDLLVLAGKLKTAKVNPGPNKSQASSAPLLDRILRDGILSAYFHAKEHIRICQLLFAINGRLIEEMGINAVKHLKDVVPMHCEILTDPFASAAPELQSLAIQSLRTIFATCWPRLGKSPYQDEILKALVISFMHADDDLTSNAQLKDIKYGLSNIAGLLLLTANDKDSLRNKMTIIVEKEPVLRDLFKDVEY